MSKRLRSVCASPEVAVQKTVQTPYGVDPILNKLVHVFFAKDRKTYRCPNCSAPLVQKKGDEIAWHFAHKAGHPDCGKSLESAIHRRGKEIILEYSRILQIQSSSIMSPLYLEYFDAKDEHTVFSIENERRVDVTAFHQPQGMPLTQLFFEICVTNPVNKEKAEELRAIGISTLELDLSSFHKKTGWTDAELVYAVIEFAPRKWVVQGPDIDAMLKNHLEKCPLFLEYERREKNIASLLNNGFNALKEVATDDQLQQFLKLLNEKKGERTASQINRLLKCSSKGQIKRSMKSAGISGEFGPDSRFGRVIFDEFNQWNPHVELWNFNAAILSWQGIRERGKQDSISPHEALVQLLKWNDSLSLLDEESRS